MLLTDDLYELVIGNVMILVRKSASIHYSSTREMAYYDF